MPPRERGKEASGGRFRGHSHWQFAIQEKLFCGGQQNSAILGLATLVWLRILLCALVGHTVSVTHIVMGLDVVAYFYWLQKLLLLVRQLDRSANIFQLIGRSDFFSFRTPNSKFVVVISVGGGRWYESCGFDAGRSLSAQKNWKGSVHCTTLLSEW